HQHTATVATADWVLSAASFVEGDGTVVSQEGRAQRFYQVFDPSYYDAEVLVRESWRWLHALRSTLIGQDVRWTQLDDATGATAAHHPALAAIVDAGPAASFRIQGLKIAREPRRYSGRTAMRANISVHEPRASQDIDTALAFSMEGYSGPNENSRLVPFAAAPGWNSPQAWSKFQDEVGGHLRGGDEGTRLFSGTHDSAYFTDIPLAFSAVAGQLRIVVRHHLFGSDELSARAAVVAPRIAEAFAGLSPVTAARLQLGAGDTLTLSINGEAVSLPVQFSASLADGAVSLPQGYGVCASALQERWVASIAGGHAE
ncbi:MAG: NADH-quinone oxidoreductase subunit G, partial [Paraperlucidibaca sp.]